MTRLIAVIGLCLAAIAVSTASEAKQHKDNPTQIPIGTPHALHHHHHRHGGHHHRPPSARPHR